MPSAYRIYLDVEVIGLGEAKSGQKTEQDLHDERVKTREN